MHIIELASPPSTNAWLRERPDTPSATVVTTPCQTAGRGQRGNSWESQPGCNLTFSILYRPQSIDARHQFAISRAVAIAIANTLADNYIRHRGTVSVKWPNDIYVGDRKICGILIEHALDGDRIGRTIIGVGININQRHFLSDAPNPVSVSMITGEKHDLDSALRAFASAILEHLADVDLRHVDNRDTYRSLLWRRDGYHPYEADGEAFDASIADVDDMGFITLEQRDGRRRRFAFKEVAAILHH